MLEQFQAPFSTGLSFPTVTVILWQRGLVGLHAPSDGFIGLAYFAIGRAAPNLLCARRKRCALSPVLLAVCGLYCGLRGNPQFLAGCGRCGFRLTGCRELLKALTALLSIYTAFELVPRIPQALAMPSTDQLNELNQSLQEEVRESQAGRSRSAGCRGSGA